MVPYYIARPLQTGGYISPGVHGGPRKSGECSLHWVLGDLSAGNLYAITPGTESWPVFYSHHVHHAQLPQWHTRPCWGTALPWPSPLACPRSCSEFLSLSTAPLLLSAERFFSKCFGTTVRTHWVPDLSSNLLDFLSFCIQFLSFQLFPWILPTQVNVRGSYLIPLLLPCFFQLLQQGHTMLQNFTFTFSPHLYQTSALEKKFFFSFVTFCYFFLLYLLYGLFIGKDCFPFESPVIRSCWL